MSKASITVTTEIELDIDTVVNWFWFGLNDEEQADFFIKLQDLVEKECGDGVSNGQWYYMAKHLRICKCSNEKTREMIRYWAETIGPEEDICCSITGQAA